MNNPLLSSVRAKIERGTNHLNEINSMIGPLVAPETDTRSVYEYDRERKHIIVRANNTQPLDPKLPLIIGDCIHNFRSALDHLVYQLAILNGSGAKSAEKTFFPICINGKTFEQRVKGDVRPFISTAALTEIEKCQPYKAYSVAAESDIWILHRLDIIDKHRLLVVAAQKMRPHWFRLTVPSGETFERTLTDGEWKPLEDGAEVIRFDLSRAIKQPGKVDVELETIHSVLLTNTGLYCDGVRVQDALAQCLLLVNAIVRDFGKLFFGE